MDKPPAWLLGLAAPIFAKPIAALFNISLGTSYVPHQWKTAVIKPICKQACPTIPSDYRPISVTANLPWILERRVVRDYIYPALEHPPNQLDLSDQFAFRPVGFTTAALIALLQTITSMLSINKYVIAYLLDFSKAFDSVRQFSATMLNMIYQIYLQLGRGLLPKPVTLHIDWWTSIRLASSYFKHCTRLCSWSTFILSYHLWPSTT